MCPYIVKYALLCITCVTALVEQDYGIIMDAGSSGTRLYVYSWDDGSWKVGYPGALPVLKEVYNQKANPGISSYANDLPALLTYMRSLVVQATSVIPPEKHADTNIFLMATAGMRLLDDQDAQIVLGEINNLMKNRTINPFQYEPENTRILSGEEEGVFAWITVNYLRDYFNPDSDVQDAGIIEIGGASAQIAFQHDGFIMSDKFPVKIGGRSYPIYAHSYLGFGQDQTLEKTQYRAIQQENVSNGSRENPCMLLGDYLNASKTQFVGTGMPYRCLEYLNFIVYSVPDELCLPKPCAIGSVYQPELNPEMPFYALSTFYFTLRTLGVLDLVDNSFNQSDSREAAIDYCSKPLREIEEEYGRYNNKFNSIECMMGLYSAVLLEKAFKFDDNSQLHATNNINGRNIEWPLGALIYEKERMMKVCDENNQHSTFPVSTANVQTVVSLVLYVTSIIMSFLPNLLRVLYYD